MKHCFCIRHYFYLFLPASILVAASVWLYLAKEPAWNIAQLQAAASHDRLIVVVAEKSSAVLRVYEKKNDVWTEHLHVGGFVGRNGISSDKREGDGATPAGLYSLRRAFGNAEDPGSLLPYRQLEPNDY